MLKAKKINFIIILGLIAIVGILVAQLVWTKQAFNLEEKKFSQKVHVALLEVVKKLYESTNNDLPSENPVEKISNDYYYVNIANDFDPIILEHYLKSEFKKAGISTDFEYAMYNCQSDVMVYGNYISLSDDFKSKPTFNFPKNKNLVYYFAIRFPNETGYLFSSLRFWFILSAALVIILLVYVYSIFTIIQQKKYSELQRDFINNMTHEFKTPLSSILIASNYLLKQEKIYEDEKLGKYTQIIIDQSNKLNVHIEKILNIAKHDNSPQELNKSELSIIPIISNVIENIQLKYENTSISIETQFNEYTIIADEFHFINLVYNLLDNSIKYCDEKPMITIKLWQEQGLKKIEFCDNGIGISTKELSLIFDKFYRSPNSKDSQVNGLGLGLYYIKKIGDLHKWKIQATNNNTKGMTFTILIPHHD
ncbi:MAG: HAMP domain-containing histidine kinase [Bacteroidetes bacterium]|nr:HAMP domain-containing histidine kinase [Bacteroidota bacterium]